jgi:cytochrome c-type biogenesis protein CcmH
MAAMIIWGGAAGLTVLALGLTCWRRWGHLWQGWLCVGLVPLAAYAVLGSPGVSSSPAGAETAEASARVAALTDSLQKDSADLAVWAELATRHAAARRWDKAEAAFRGALVLAPDAPQLKAGLGEVLINRAGGMVPAEAEELFGDVLTAQPDDLAGLYYLGLAAVQRQDTATAKGYWDRLAQIVPRDMPWYGDFMANYRALMLGDS